MQTNKEIINLLENDIAIGKRGKTSTLALRHLTAIADTNYGSKFIRK